MLELILIFLMTQDWQAPKGKDCKMKCRIRLEREPLLNDDKVIQEFLTRKFLRFNICILKEPNKLEGKSRGEQPRHNSSAVSKDNEEKRVGEVSKFNTNYVIDLQLVKGTPTTNNPHTAINAIIAINN